MRERGKESVCFFSWFFRFLWCWFRVLWHPISHFALQATGERFQPSTSVSGCCVLCSFLCLLGRHSIFSLGTYLARVVVSGFLLSPFWFYRMPLTRGCFVLLLLETLLSSTGRGDGAEWRDPKLGCVVCVFAVSVAGRQWPWGEADSIIVMIIVMIYRHDYRHPKRTPMMYTQVKFVRYCRKERKKKK